MHQLLSGIAYMHEEWVIHRDLKTANLLLSHGNILKIGDFGLAREYGDPLKPYTSLVVTLHYRCPELLLGCKVSSVFKLIHYGLFQTYSTAVDMWSIGCIFGEFFKLNAIFPAQSEAEQVKLIFEAIGTPNERIWPGYNDLPLVRKFAWAMIPSGQLKSRFFNDLNKSEVGFELMTGLLHPCPERRISAEKALKSEWFTESPLPAPPESFPTWPAKSENLKPPPRRVEEPEKEAKKLDIDPERLKLLREFKINPRKSTDVKGGFSLKFAGK
jgi:cell division cycle 2-like protein